MVSLFMVSDRIDSLMTVNLCIKHINSDVKKVLRVQDFDVILFKALSINKELSTLFTCRTNDTFEESVANVS